MIKSILTLVAVCCVVAIAGCHNNKTNDGSKASPGAMKECAKCASGTCDCMCCKTGGKKLATATGCCCDGHGVCCKEMNKANMGAVGEKKSGCCSGDAAKSGTSMGAVGEKKDGCCSGAKKD